MSEKEEFEKLPEAIPMWIKDHVELYLSEPEHAPLWDSTIGGGPGPLPTLPHRARSEEREAPAAAAPLPGDRWEVRRHRFEGRRACASGLVRESEGESGVRNPSGREAHARPRAHSERRGTNARLEQDGGDVSAVRRLPEASGFTADPGGGSRSDWSRVNARITEAAG
jgi:hypothetical protein